jgi:hypothetical protein
MKRRELIMVLGGAAVVREVQNETSPPTISPSSCGRCRVADRDARLNSASQSTGSRVIDVVPSNEYPIQAK